MEGARGAYRIIDEPRPGSLAHLVVNPYWIVLTLMLGGAWIGWPWFVLNALALGSATKIREIALCATSLTLNFALTLGVFYAADTGMITVRAARYALIGVPAIKMGLGFVVFRMQERSHSLFTYFGGSERSGVPVLIAGFIGRGALLGDWVSNFWSWVLG